MMNIRNVLHSGDVVRFHNHVGIEKQKNSEHQWGVALILHFIYPSCSKHLLVAALTHDAAEYFTGDIPFPTKAACPELSRLLVQLEKQWEADNGIERDLHWEEHVAIKFCDTLEGMWYCVNQVKIGNINAKRPFRKWRKFITDLITEQSKNPSDQMKEIISRTNSLLNKVIQEMEEL